MGLKSFRYMIIYIKICIFFLIHYWFIDLGRSETRGWSHWFSGRGCRCWFSRILSFRRMGYFRGPRNKVSLLNIIFTTFISIIIMILRSGPLLCVCFYILYISSGCISFCFTRGFLYSYYKKIKWNFVQIKKNFYFFFSKHN